MIDIMIDVNNKRKGVVGSRKLWCFRLIIVSLFASAAQAVDQAPIWDVPVPVGTLLIQIARLLLRVRADLGSMAGYSLYSSVGRGRWLETIDCSIGKKFFVTRHLVQMEYCRRSSDLEKTSDMR